MKYPRITYGELISFCMRRPELQTPDQVFYMIYPNIYFHVQDQADEVLRGLGYIVWNDPSLPAPENHSCTEFEENYLTHSGDKLLSSDFYNTILIELGGTIYADVRDKGYLTRDDFFSYVNDNIVQIMWILRRAVLQFIVRSWNNIYKIFKAYTTQYKPLENYSMIEDTDYTPLAKQTVKSSNKSKTDTTTDVGVFGFNSTVAVPSSSTDSGTTQLKADNEMETETSYDGKADNTHHERSGNIGVTTSQQMLESEIKLRKLEILELIFQGLDEVICQSVYD